MKPIFNASVLLDDRKYIKYYTKKDKEGKIHSAVTVEDGYEEYYAYPYDLAWKIPIKEFASIPPILYIEDSEISNKITLREDQIPYVAQLLQRPRGIFVSKPGTGKTVMCLDLIAKSKLKTLVLVNTNYLLYQWVEECTDLLGYTPGIIGDGKFDIKDITVATFQTLSRSYDKLKTIRDNFSLIIVDECHHVPALTFAQILRQLNAVFKLGVTGTLTRKDGLQFIAEWHLSDNKVVNTTDNTIKPEIFIIRTGVKIPNGESFVESLTSLAENKEVLSRVEEMVDAHKERNQLVLSSRVKTVELLAERYENAIAITGEIGDRSNLNERILESKLIVSTLLNEGVNIPNLDTLHLIHPSNNLPQLEQRIARINRPQKGKENTYVLDYWYKSNKQALGFNILNQQKTRLNYYKKQGYIIHEVQF